MQSRRETARKSHVNRLDRKAYPDRHRCRRRFELPEHSEWLTGGDTPLGDRVAQRVPYVARLRRTFRMEEQQIREGPRIGVGQWIDGIACTGGTVRRCTADFDAHERGVIRKDNRERVIW